MSMNMNKMNKNMVEEYAMGFMLEYTEDQYKNDETLEQIKNELINLYDKVHNNELNSYSFYSSYYSNFDYSASIQMDYRAQEKKFFIIMKDLIFSLKKDNIRDIEIAWKNEEEYFEENGERTEFWDTFPASVYNFFITCNKSLIKHNKVFILEKFSYCDWGVAQNEFIINVCNKFNEINKIYIHKDSTKKIITCLHVQDIHILLENLKENESIQILKESEELVLHKLDNNRFSYQKYSNKIKSLLPYIFNTNNYSLMSMCIHLIDYKLLKKMDTQKKMKINKFIQISNKNNEILLKNKMCNDMIKHIINKMINPEEIEKVCVYEGEKILKNVNEKVDSFIEKCDEKTEKELIKLIGEILKDIERIDDIIKEEKYKNMKKYIKVNIIKNLYRLNFTDLANTLFKKRPDFLQINKERAIDLKNKTDDIEFHRILDCFLEKYQNDSVMNV